MQNRKSAKKCRLKKKAEFGQMRGDVMKLYEENKSLKEKVSTTKWYINSNRSMKSPSCYTKRWKKILPFRENSNNPRSNRSCSSPRSRRISSPWATWQEWLQAVEWTQPHQLLLPNRPLHLGSYHKFRVAHLTTSHFSDRPWHLHRSTNSRTLPMALSCCSSYWEAVTLNWVLAVLLAKTQQIHQPPSKFWADLTHSLPP